MKDRGMRTVLQRVCLGLALLMLCVAGHAFLFPQLGMQLSPQLKKGTVMTRAQVLGDNGGPILVVTRTTGSASGAQTEEIEEIGEIYPTGPLGEVYILSGAEVGYFLDKTARLRIERGETMQRAVFLDPEELANGITVANGETSESVNVPDSVKTVLVLGERDRFGTDPSRWTLIEYPFLMNEDFTLEDNASSVLFDEEGEQIRTVFGTSDESGNYSVEQFTYRVGYWGDGEDAMEQDQEGYSPRGDDRIFGPVSGAELDMAFSSGMSGADGRYQLFYMHYCLGLQTGSGFLPLTAPTAASINLVLKASIYNPQGKAYFPLLMQRQTEFFCGDVSGLPDHNFIVDVLWLSGKLRLANTANGDTLPMGDEVLYQGEDRQGEAMAQSSFDFDGDGEPDISVHANKKTETDDEGNSYVIPNQEGEADSKRWQAVYFSSGSHRPDAESLPEQVPDLWRLADHSLDTKETGLYSQITQDVLVNTDLYVFQESTGELIVELNGMPDGIGDGRDLTGDGDYFTYNTVMRGPKQHSITSGLCKGKRGDDCLLRTLYDGSGDADRALLEGNGNEAYQLDAEQLGFQSRFQQRDGGLPAPGEWMYVVAINRTTGYTGTVRFQLGQPYGQGAIGPSITQRVPEITLTPPNLKVWAKRVYDIDKGLTKDETVNYLIGHEGAATQNDTLVGIYTEWLDSDGRPLPAGLDIDQGKDFGLSGRLAKIAGDELVPVSSGLAVEAGDFDIEEAQQGSQIAEFPIGPGQRLQLLRLKADNTRNEHYYVNVFGRAINKEACGHCEFDEADKHQDLLTGRPNHYTPFYVPRYDEQATLELKLERNKLRVEESEAQEDGAAPPDDEDKLGKVTAQYDWMLRPEYQFTLLDIEVNELNAIRKQTNKDGSEEEIVRNLIDQDQPVITSSDDLIRLLYNLILPEDDALQSLDGTREYVLALGEEEVRITAGEDQTIDIENLDHLASLDVEDFLTMRLYLSNDQENVLWQWAFGVFDLLPADNPRLNADERYIEVSADDAANSEEIVSGILFREINGEPDSAEVKWRVIGAAQASPTVQYKDDGVFFTSLTLPTTADETVQVEAIIDGDTERPIASAIFKIMPGLANDISVTSNGETVVGGLGEITLSLTVKDSYGNNVKDGTPVDVSAPGAELIAASSVLDGKSEIILKGVDQAGDINVVIAVDLQEVTEIVTIHDIDLAVSVPEGIEAGEQGSVTVSASSSYGDLAGLEVHLAAHRGRLDDYFVTLGQDGTASVRYVSGDYPGFAQVSAKVGSRIASKQFSVIQIGATLSRRELVVDGTGSIAVGGGSIDFGPSTELVVPGGVGETISATLALDDAPPVYPLLDYSAENRGKYIGGNSSEGEVNVIDYSSGVDAVGFNAMRERVEDKPWSTAWRIAEEGHIDIPRHALLTALKQPGVTFQFAVLQPPTQDAVLLDYDAQGFGLSLSSSGEAMLRFTDEEGDKSLSLGVVPFSQWHSASVHYRDGVLRAKIDGVSVQATPVGDLVPGGADYGAQVGNYLAVDVALLKIYDWSKEQKLSFTGGGMDGEAAVGEDGFARFSITAQAPQVAYQQLYRQAQYAASPFDFVLPSAYAANTDIQVCANTIAEPPEDANDPLIANAERFMKVLLDCVVKQQVDAAFVEYETANGVFRRGMLLTKAVTYQGLYGALKVQADSAILAANCLDAAITGNNDTTVGGVCDFITALLAIGDIRDLLIQTYNYFFNEGEFDSTVTILAGLGIVGTIATATGVGVVANVGVASAKTIVKALRKLGPEAADLLKTLSHYLDSKVIEAPTNSAAIKVLERTTPFLEVGAFAVLERETLQFMAKAITNPDNLDTWINYVAGYVERAKGALAHSDSIDGLFIDHAYAASRPAQEFVTSLKKAIEPPLHTKNSIIAQAFTKALKSIDEGAATVDDILAGLKNDKDAMRALVQASALSDSALKNLRNHRGFNLGLLKREEFLKRVGDVDFRRLIDEADDPELMEKGLNKVFAQLNAGTIGTKKGFNNAQGATHQLMMISWLARSGRAVKGVEVERLVKAADGSVIGRRVDDVVEGGTPDVFADAKAWAPDKIQQRIISSMSFKLGEGLDSGKGGQLYLDMIDLAQGKKTKWYFDPRAAGMKEEIVDAIKKGIDKNREYLGKHLGIDGDDGKALTEALDDLKSKLGDFVDFVEY
tara:strand:+ start:117683 stop:124189 length:6507 start_codon:yes stop_codon:yes gene_type:complete